jgi:membrane protein
MRELLGRIRERIGRAYQWLDARTFGVPSTLRDVAEGFDRARAPEAAASMAYYAFFSLFPLLLVLVAIGSFFLESERVYEQVVRFSYQAFPVSLELIESNIDEVLRLRGPVGIIGVAGLLWAATGFFTVLTHHINRAWQQAVARSVLQRRLLALRMVGILLGLLFFSLLPSIIAGILARLEVPIQGTSVIYESPLWPLLTSLLPWFLAFLLLGALYRWVPNTPVRWREALGGALVAALAFELIATAFSWFLGSGLIQYELIYGSLGTVVVLLFWIYLSTWIILVGAHFCAAIARRHERSAIE